jgi:RNA-binding protein 23/39
MAMSAQSRADLMMKLARDTDLIHQVSNTHLNDPLQQPTQFILLANMYDPVAEAATSASWVDDLTEDIYEECAKFGTILHLKVMGTQLGEVFIKYSDVPSAQLAIAALQNRWFAGRQLQAYFIPASIYASRVGSQ